MNEGQQKFYNFVLARVKEGKQEEIKDIMNESFRRQQEGTFTKEYMAETVPKMIMLLRPECVEEFKKAAEHMSSQLRK
jgi:ketol-acid reductoisomerase